MLRGIRKVWNAHVRYIRSDPDVYVYYHSSYANPVLVSFGFSFVCERTRSARVGATIFPKSAASALSKGACPRFSRHSVRLFSNGSGAWTACPLQLTTAGFARNTAQCGCWKHAVIVECHVFAMQAACEWLGTVKGACIHPFVSSIEHTSGQVRGRSCAACERNGDWEKAGMCLCSKPSWLRGGGVVCTFSR